MLELFNIESIGGDTKHAGAKVLNTNFITEVETYSTTKARFQFLPKPDDRRGGKNAYVVTESRAFVTNSMNRSFNAKALTLSVYPDNDTTETAVPTVFHADEIVRVYPHTRSSRDTCWVEVNEKGNKLRRYRCAHYYIDVMDYSYTGSSTTTTSTTSTSSTSSTSTTSTSSTTT